MLEEKQSQVSLVMGISKSRRKWVSGETGDKKTFLWKSHDGVIFFCNTLSTTVVLKFSSVVKFSHQIL